MLRTVSAISLMAAGAFATGVVVGAAGVAAGVVYHEPLRRAAKSTMKTVWRASRQLGERFETLRDEFEDARAEVAAERDPAAAGSTASSH